MWLLKEETFQAMAEARRAGFVVTAEHAAAHLSRMEPTAEGLPRNLKIAGDQADIHVQGVLTKRPDFFSYYFGGGNTTYEQIQQALGICAADATIKNVRLVIDSPGGHVDGLFDTLAALDAFSKPMSVSTSKACSAAYAIAAVAGKIEATTAGVEVGSIGVAARFFVDPEHIVDIASTDAPAKRPDVSTEEGKAVVREELDAIHELFVDAIAHGRATTTKRVNADFGRGATLLAGDAKKRGMIDRIAKPALRAVEASDTPEEETDPKDASAQEGGAPTAEEKRTMNKEELKAKHSELYSALVEEGAKAERDRVCAHLTLGEQSGDMKTAIAAITSGEGMTQTLTAKYLAAGMNRAAGATRQQESDAAGAAIPSTAKPATGSAGTEATKDFGDLVADSMGLPVPK